MKLMKKNKLMRLASVLLILCLLTTSVISGTFAKYATTDSGTDTARVAKFGVVASVTGDLFGAEYDYVGEAGANGIITWTTANAGAVNGGAADSMVLAPGTVGGTMKFSITGTPEVATEVTFGNPLDKSGTAVNFVDTDITLKAGNYGIMKPVTVTLTDENKGQYWALSDSTFSVNTATSGTVYELVDAVEVSSNYLPIKWTVGSTANIADVAAARTALETALTVSNDSPNQSVAASSSLTWQWPFTNATASEITAQDKQDTILGDLIALGTETNIDGSYVVVQSGASYIALKLGTQTIQGPSDGSIPNQVITFAYKATEGTAPATWNDTKNVAVLTESFGASLTVVQVD